MTTVVATRIAALPGARRRFMTAGALGFLAFGVWAPLTLVFYTLHRGLPVATTGAALTVGAGAAAVLAIRPAGALSDRLGPFRALTIGAAVQALGAAVTAAPVHSPVLPALAAFLGGAGNSVFFTADTEAIRRVSADQDQCDRMFAQMASVRLISFGLGAAAGGLVLMFEQRQPWLWVAGVETCAAVLAAVALLCATLWHVDDDWIPFGDTERCTDPPPSYASVLRQSEFLVFVFGQFGVALVTIGLDSVLALYVLAVRLPRLSVPVSTALACLVAAAAPVLAHRAARRFGRLPVLTAAAVLAAAAFGGYALAAVWGTVTLIVAALAFGAADGVGAALGSAVALSFAPRHLSGRHASIHAAAWSLGGVLAPLIYTALFTRHPMVPWLFSVVLMLSTAAAYRWARGHRG